MVEHSGRVTVAVAQWEHHLLADFDDFAARVAGLLDRTGDAQVAIFPEKFTISLLTMIPGWQDLAPAEFGLVDRFTDAYRELFQEEARRRGKVILAGSHLVGDATENRNTAFLFTPDGAVRTHAKTHILPVEADSNTREGDQLFVVDVGFVSLGIAICYEAEIPEVATILARRGAELILCPSYTTTPAGFWRVRYCAQARCIENQVFFAHCSTVGHIGGSVSDGFGKSSVLSPCDVVFPANGVLAEAAQDVEDVAITTIDLDLLYENRRTGTAPTCADRVRRAGLYHRYAEELLADAAIN